MPLQDITTQPICINVAEMMALCDSSFLTLNAGAHPTRYTRVCTHVGAKCISSKLITQSDDAMCTIYPSQQRAQHTSCFIRCIGHHVDPLHPLRDLSYRYPQEHPRTSTTLRGASYYEEHLILIKQSSQHYVLGRDSHHATHKKDNLCSARRMCILAQRAITRDLSPS